MPPALDDLHAAGAWVVVGANLVAGSWALAAHRWPRWRTKWLWWFTAAAQATILVQVVLGVALGSAEDLEPPDELHELYGFGALAGVAIVYSYRGQLDPSRHHLLYGGAGLFLMGMALRATL